MNWNTKMSKTREQIAVSIIVEMLDEQEKECLTWDLVRQHVNHVASVLLWDEIWDNETVINELLRRFPIQNSIPFFGPIDI